MDVAQVVRELGGVARSDVLTAAVPRSRLRRAVTEGTVVRLAHGLYGLPGTASHRSVAMGLDAALSLESAALAHGWGVKLPPDRAQVVVARDRKVTAVRRAGVDLRWGQVTRAELDAGVTDKVRTVVDCARLLPFDAALAVVDSALRDGVPRTDLLLACARSPRTGRSRAFEVVELGTRRAANPFESVLRAVVHTVPGASFEPQVWIGSVGRSDLADRAHRVVLEADSFEFHAASGPFAADMERYNAFVAEGWRVLRFAWKHVMFDQDAVRATVAAVLRPPRPAVDPCPGCPRA